MKGSKKKKDMRREPGRDYQKLLKYTLQGKKRKLKKLLSRGQVAALYTDVGQVLAGGIIADLDE